jgi:hypothetical protein
MFSMRHAAITFALAATVSGCVTETSGELPVPRAPAGVELGRLARLEGDWYRIGTDGAASSELVSRFRVSAAGTAVVETMFPDTENEMVTVYHRDGDALILQHYCSHGNQPRMAATGASTADAYVFDYVGGGNMEIGDPHVHSITLRFLGEDELGVEVTHWSAGAADENGSWKLVRRG